MENKIIYGLNGKPIEVTDLEAALSEARWCVNAHENMKELHDKGEDVFYFKDAHAHWNHVLKQLEKL